MLALTAAHFVLDCFPGLMHTVLPAFQESFRLSVAAGAVLLTIFLVASNAIQVLIGHMRPEHDKPLFLYIGLLLTCSILLFWIVPAGGMALLWLSVIALVSGAGVGMTHPEALKAVHRLDEIPSAVSSTIFMGGGVIGFAFSGWSSTWLFTRWRFAGLVPFCAASVVILMVLIGLRIRLAVERDEPARRTRRPPETPLSFWLIMTIATLAACSTQTLMWILPQHISHIGANLTVGGLAVSMFSVAGGFGGIVLSKQAARHGEIKITIRMLLCGIPFMVAYLLFVRYTWAVVLLFAAGFFCFGAYPLMVSAARHSEGPNLGRRMGLIVGGIWLGACLLPMLLGPVAEHFGTLPILFCVPIGFVLSLLLAVKARTKGSDD